MAAKILEHEETDRTLVLVHSVRDLRGYALSITGNDDDAEDLLQEAALRVLLSPKHCQSVRSDHGWLRSVIRNLFIDLLRKQKREPHNTSLSTCDEAYTSWYGRLLRYEPDIDEWLVVRQVQQYVRAAIDELTPEHCEVVRLHYIAGMSISEVADATGLPSGTVSSRLARARAELRVLLRCLVVDE